MSVFLFEGRRPAVVRALSRLALIWLVALALTATARAQTGGEAPPSASAGDEAAPRAEGEETILHAMWRTSGLIGLVIAVMSFYLIALAIWMAFQYRKSVAVPEALVREVSDLLDQKRYSDAYQRLATDPSFLGRVLAAGVRKLPSGQAPALRAMGMANDDATMEMEHRTTYLATVGTLGPMIGLVGTVYGMIISFRVIATAGSSPQASALAGGISTALFATLEGIGVSIPAIYFYALYRNRIARLSLEVEITAESLLERFAAGVRTAHPLASAAVQGNGGALGPLRSALPPSERPG